MGTIYLDPVGMDSTAGAIGDHAEEVHATVDSLETACWAQVPAPLEGWLAEELNEIAVTARVAAVLYLVAALDAALRAQQIQADQSLATALPALASTSASFTPTVMGGFSALATTPDPGSTGLAGGPSIVGGTYLGASPGPGAVTMPGLSTQSFQAQNPFMGVAILGAGASGFGAGPLDFAGAVANHAIANALAPDGLHAVSPGVFEDDRGRQGHINQAYRDPRTNRLEF